MQIIVIIEKEVRANIGTAMQIIVVIEKEVRAVVLHSVTELQSQYTLSLL